jgi:integrase
MPKKSKYLEEFENKHNLELVQNYVQHRKLGKPINGRAKKPIGDKTEKKILIWLRKISSWIDKNLDEVTEQDIDQFRKNLRCDLYRQQDGKAFSELTKRDIEYKVMRPFFQWMGKRDMVEFVSSYNEIKEVPAISRESVLKIINVASIREKVIFAILFDGGLRADEFLNVRYSDIKDDERHSKGYYKVRVVKSKTKPRTVHLWMDETTEILDSWLDLNKNKLGTNEKLVSLSYPHFLNAVKRTAKKVLGIDVNPHLLRHSSATHYCHKLNQYQMCKRYGWTMGSKMPQIYIDREGVDMEDLSEKITTENAVTYRKEVNQLREQNNILQEQMRAQEKEMKDQMAQIVAQMYDLGQIKKEIERRK